MAGFGGELLLFIGLGYLILGPQRMRTILLHIARAKSEFSKTQQEFQSQLATGLEGKPKDTSG